MCLSRLSSLCVWMWLIWWVNISVPNDSPHSSLVVIVTTQSICSDINNSSSKQRKTKVASSPLWWNSWSALQISRVCDGGTATSSRSSAGRADRTRIQCGPRHRSELHLSGIRGERYFSWCLYKDKNSSGSIHHVFRLKRKYRKEKCPLTNHLFSQIIPLILL